MSAIVNTVTSRVAKHAILLLGVALIVSWPAPAQPADPDWKAVEAALASRASCNRATCSGSECHGPTSPSP